MKSKQKHSRKDHSISSRCKSKKEKKHKDEKRKKKKKRKDRLKQKRSLEHRTKLKSIPHDIDSGGTATGNSDKNEIPGPAIPAGLIEEQRRSRLPLTKEEWEKNQSVIRKVYDESTGRTRLIKGDGEVLEEIVSKERHREINKQATQGDGEYFQSHHYRSD